MKPSDFLTELYALDPSLRDREAELLPLIESLLASDPARSPDPAFVSSLRTRLTSRAAELSTSSHAEGVRWVPSLFSTMNKFFTIAIPAAAIAVVIPVVFLFRNQTNGPLALKTTTPSSAVAQDEGREAFGSLTGVDNAANPTISARPQSGGGGPAFGMGGGGGLPVPPAVENAVDAKMIAPYPMTHYDYVFEGDLPALADSVDVYKRTPKGGSPALGDIAPTLNVDGLDLASFGGMRTDSLTFTNNQPFGYQVYINFRDATVNIDAQWDTWPMSKCADQACYDRERVTIKDIPSDADIIAIAKAFVADHGIDIADRGEPQVDNQWRRDYDRTPDKSVAYVPDTIRVVFPQMIDGKPVYDQSGGASGLNVNVQVKYKRVMGVYGITASSYAKSAYDGITDATVIRDALRKIDNYPIPVDAMPRDAKTQNVTVHLGAPTVSYVLFYRYVDNKNEELLVPSLVFPVTKVDDAGAGYYFRQSVVIPLAKDMFEEQNRVMPVPMGAGGGVMY